MITKITLEKVSSYKKAVTLETDKKVNLIYGLNGTGKSTLSNLLYKTEEEKFKNCKIEGLSAEDSVLVYNQTFINDNFFESEDLNGIFTLSAQNKEVEVKILNAENEIKRLYSEKSNKENELTKGDIKLNEIQETARERVWQIKKDYSGGDRVLEYCLEGLKSDSKKLLAFIELRQKPDKPLKTIETLKVEVQNLSGDKAQKYNHLPLIKLTVQSIEENKIFKKIIIGNEHSTVSSLINKLQNSDWVRTGLKYLPKEVNETEEKCPLCQHPTITAEFITDINNYFDESYESDIALIKRLLEEYVLVINMLPDSSIFENNPKYALRKREFELKLNLLKATLNENLKLMEGKVQKPSLSFHLKTTKQPLEDLNDTIKSINQEIGEHNNLMDQRDGALIRIKESFWDIMRWDYDQIISPLIDARKEANKVNEIMEKSIESITREIANQRKIIAEQQKQTINIEEAINSINVNLLELGIDGFKIKNHSKNLYKIVRGDNEVKVFHSLSEGEKMIISFLYFLELCRGKRNSSEAVLRKIIVIDDPISSLSHIYIFNIGRLIKSEFFGKKETKKGIINWNYKYDQVFILTHSLYFFYEITETNPEARKENQKLFRLVKNEEGSNLIPMSYEEIQNDYQAYWSIIKDEKQPPALIANCMRNVIEYFFNFVEKKDLNNFFLQPDMQEIRFQAFYRYVNRESHSLGQNIFDFKEFDYDIFKEAFAALFKVSGYEDHYKKMIR